MPQPLNYYVPEGPARPTLQEVSRDLWRQRVLILTFSYALASYVTLALMTLGKLGFPGLLHFRLLAAPIVVPYDVMELLSQHNFVPCVVFVLLFLGTFLGLWIPWRRGARQTWHRALQRAGFRI